MQQLHALFLYATEKGDSHMNSSAPFLSKIKTKKKVYLVLSIYNSNIPLVQRSTKLSNVMP